ncbi:fungal-specific transcription factor domain-containing protein [Xylariaceae sp. FL1651]|nr:fungal-specific transcription factor domain-containing protein [Xylariaceae sp. FL1651]
MSAMPPKPMTRSRHGCWTCKARKVQCDRGMPTCQKCTRARRECQGYGLRLSWPKDNDKRRAAVTAILPPTEARTRYTSRHLFINTTFWDIELYRRLSLPTAMKPPKLGQCSPSWWGQPQSRVTHMELVYYFRDAAHYSLVTFNPITQQIRDVLMRMTLTQDTVSGEALFYALLAFSSLHRSGPHRETMTFKVTALQALSASAKGAAQGWVEATQHVAACMLLCAFEILLPSESSGEWFWYIRGAKEIVQRTQLGQKSSHGDFGSLLDWVYYHDTLSRFTMYHWRHDYVALESAHTSSPDHQGVEQSPLMQERTASLSPNPTHAILNVLSEVCDVLLDPRDPRSREKEYMDRLTVLEWKLNNLPSPSSSTSDSGTPNVDLELTVQLFQLATLIYLARASQNPLKPPAKLGHLVDEVFAGPVPTCSCRHVFPLFIIACEANTDEQRAAILEMIDRSEKRGYVRSMAAFRAQLQSFWIQQDLHADSDLILDYLSSMKAVISSNRALPSYV